MRANGNPNPMMEAAVTGPQTLFLNGTWTRRELDDYICDCFEIAKGHAKPGDIVMYKSGSTNRWELAKVIQELDEKLLLESPRDNALCYRKVHCMSPKLLSLRQLSNAPFVEEVDPAVPGPPLPVSPPSAPQSQAEDAPSHQYSVQCQKWNDPHDRFVI